MRTIEGLHPAELAPRQRPAICPVRKTCARRPATSRAGNVFQSHRPRLFGIAYRMLGTRADAEDVLQDAYLRWHEAAESEIESPIGFLITVTTRLCLDRLRQSKREREQHTGPWLSVPMEDYVPSPEEQGETAEEVSAAFLAVLERLGSQERAAFMLREVF